ncbi:hypothetical protein BS78_05G079100 [Paspalum vaginatum]|nr:hypothetical protein BS78_05G079100 [Paspalum vaginatum]KAJ1274666.1 hypothetical protein BS78_05G079100 [Paspalum vaginatum]
MANMLDSAATRVIAVVVVKLLLVLLVAAALGTLQLTTCASVRGNETDRLALVAFKEAIALDPQQALRSWNDSTHFCSWEGVQCRATTNSGPPRVTSLNLTDRGLAGRLSPSLGNLTFIRRLVLPRNAFTGGIPASLGRLRRLQVLVLTNNTLQGIIPSFANCTGLKNLQLADNGLVGRFPDDLPYQLQRLELEFNGLTGTIPASLGNITTLITFSCASNSIEGSIPVELARLRSLRFFAAGENQLAGRFPHAVLNLSGLTDLSFPLNRLSGKIPSNLGDVLPNLQALLLGVNFFDGNILYSLMNASNLSLLDMSSNNFTGVVPSSIGQLSKLSFLNLEKNQLQAHDRRGWEFMNSLTNCTMLHLISLASNQLEGPVPNSLGNLSSQLHVLYLGKNKLSGGFPAGIANLPNLYALALNDNQFTGELPEWLGTLKSLQIMSVPRNNFTGFIPSSLSNLSQLISLFLDSNQFGGNLDASFGKLRMLNTLSISDNFLHGRIPRDIFGIPALLQIDLSSNNLDGQLPREVGNAQQLVSLVLSSNKLSGEIPNTLGTCESLQYVMLDKNNLSGTIPAALGNLSTLRVLNLSRNNLTGPIPVSLSSLQLLQQLDLSFNHLKGEVPTEGIFNNATAMRIDGNQGLCGGPPELHLLVCPFMPLDSAKHKSSFLLKVIIPVAIVVSLAVFIYVLLLFRRQRQKGKSISLPTYGRGIPKISYGDLVRATEGFATSNLIGQGRYGSVYRGNLFRDGNAVAIKVFSLNTRGAQKSFITECNALRNVRHRNLVPILTACSSMDSSGNDFKALVYVFMPGGDLHNVLYSARDSEGSPCLNHISLAQRLNILVDVADALEYLHHSYQESIVHCDLKPSNILLNDDMVAHVGDFGLAKFTFDSATSSVVDSNSTSSNAIKGTIGYVAPECAAGGQVSTASDTYSFGVVLLEIFIRRRPTDDMFRDGMSIAKFAEANFPDNVSQIVDPLLVQELDVVAETQILQSVLSVGLRCTKTNPNERISMQEVAGKLHVIRDAYLRSNRRASAVV